MQLKWKINFLNLLTSALITWWSMKQYVNRNPNIVLPNTVPSFINVQEGLWIEISNQTVFWFTAAL